MLSTRPPGVQSSHTTNVKKMVAKECSLFCKLHLCSDDTMNVRIACPSVYDIQSVIQSIISKKPDILLFPHSLKTDCLQSWFGVCGTVFKWFTSYFTNHVQSIKISSTLPESYKLLFGVPQGSVIGPLLFSLYTFPLSSIIRRHKGVGFHFYANLQSMCLPEVI